MDSAGSRDCGALNLCAGDGEPKELLNYALACKKLQESGKFEGEIEFKDSSCFIKDGTDKMAQFKALIGSASEPSTKLVSES